jgi:hypothetical protein
VQRLLDGLIGGFHRQAERRADAGRGGRAQMGDMIDLVFVQADAFDQCDLNFVSGRQSTDEIGARSPAMLSRRENRRNIVSRMRIVGSQKGVVEIEFTHRHAVGPSRPLGRHHVVTGQSENRRAGLMPVRLRLRTGVEYRASQQGRGRNGGVVDDAIADHLNDGRTDGHRISGDFGDLPSELRCAREVLGGFVRTDGMQLHDRVSSTD